MELCKRSWISKGGVILVENLYRVHFISLGVKSFGIKLYIPSGGADRISRGKSETLWQARKLEIFGIFGDYERNENRYVEIM